MPFRSWARVRDSSRETCIWETPIALNTALLLDAAVGNRFCTTVFGLHLAPGQGLLLYTDGLTEARTVDGHMLADTSLTDFLAQREVPVSAGALIDDTVALLDTLPDTERGDVALLALSVPTNGAAPAGITTTARSAAAPTAPASVGQEIRRP